ncbi:MAG: CDP-alcohol phosphatidyltransferase family protein [Flavobacteriaceae bacterium]|nr:CDP-alcohol phosphatidyltransferase family protein [Flavobacteriaceae bacterium]
MNIKKQIPNLFTLGNLLCGTIAVIAAVNADFELTALLVVLGIVFDFFDGFLARMLHVTGELGKQLDSLADMVTSGVVPGIVMLSMIEINYISQSEVIDFNNKVYAETIFDTGYIKFLGLLLTLAACYRLANFNIDTRQSDSFIGLPTPAMSLFVIALPLIPMYTENQFFIDQVQNNYFLIGAALLLSYLMNAEIQLFSLKFKSFGVQENGLKYVFLLTSLVLLLVLHVIAIPLVIILYVLLSVGSNLSKKKAV